MNITAKGKNFDPRAKYWWPNVWYREAKEARWITPVNAPSGPIPITQDTVQFQNIPSNVGFAAGFYTSPSLEDIIGGTFAFAATDILVLHDKATYIVDFQGNIGIPTVSEKAVEETPSWMQRIVSLEMLIPMPPGAGPPLPQGFKIYWPWYKGPFGPPWE